VKPSTTVFGYFFSGKSLALSRFLLNPAAAATAAGAGAAVVVSAPSRLVKGVRRVARAVGRGVARLPSYFFGVKKEEQEGGMEEGREGGREGGRGAGDGSSAVEAEGCVCPRGDAPSCRVGGAMGLGEVEGEGGREGGREGGMLCLVLGGAGKA